MVDIDKIIEDVIRREGGDKVTNHPNDEGSWTRYGITIETLSQWRNEEATPEDIKNLSKEEAKEIYKHNYYLNPKIDRLPESIQEFVFDCCVNHGPKTAIIFVQQTCNQNGYPAGKPDGIVGPKTTKAAHKFDRQFLDELIDRRENYYYKIVENRPDQAVFLAGWLEHRVEAFKG